MHLLICTTCALIYTNDDDTAMTPDEAFAHRAKMVNHTPQWRGRVVLDHPFEARMSEAPCSSCGERLPGDRFAAVLVED